MRALSTAFRLIWDTAQGAGEPYKTDSNDCSTLKISYLKWIRTKLFLQEWGSWKDYLSSQTHEFGI